MEEATNRPKGKRKRGKRAARRSPRINEEHKLSLDAPPRSRFKGYDDFMVQDLRLERRVIRYRRERWLTPEGKLLIAPLPAGLRAGYQDYVINACLGLMKTCQKLSVSFFDYFGRRLDVKGASGVTPLPDLVLDAKA